MSTSKPPSALDLLFPPGFVVAESAPQDASTDILNLFDDCGRSLRRYILSFGLSADEADDIVQEVFLALFRHVRLGRPGHNLKGWLFRVAHNLALRQRKRRKRLDDTNAGDESLAWQVPDSARNPEEQLADAQWQGTVMAVLRRMPERDRRCLYLRAEGLRYREIARVLGVSLGSVAKSLTRSLALLCPPAAE